MPRGKSFAGYDQEDEYDDVDEDDFAPFVEAVELGYFNNSPVVVSRSNQTAAASSNSDTVASVSSTPKTSKGFAPKKHYQNLLLKVVKGMVNILVVHRRMLLLMKA